MTKVAAIDCGTNSIRLLIAEVDAGAGTLRDLDRRMEIVRLGEDVDRTGMLAEAALERTFAAAEQYAAACAEHGVERLRFVATSATRDAANRSVFVDGIRDRLGVEPEVVSGAEEASLSFAGATRELAGGGCPPPYIVVDIGGGSTEVVRGTDSVDTSLSVDDSNAVEDSLSVDIGCVRLTERHLHSDPPTPDEIAAACSDITAALDRVEERVSLADVGTLVGLAGTVTTVAAHCLALDRYDSHRIHRSRLPVADVVTACDDLLAMNRAWREALPYMHPGRVDVIGAGALIWREVIRRVGSRGHLAEVLVSEHDILDGIAWSAAT